MNEYECVQIKHHRDVGPAIEKLQADGWHLHTYQASGVGVSNDVKHYLLFERGGRQSKKTSSRYLR